MHFHLGTMTRMSVCVEDPFTVNGRGVIVIGKIFYKKYIINKNI